jgi:hypothetical protein
MMALDPALDSALDDALAAVATPQSEEFRRRFRRLVENALIANHTDAEVRRVLELATVLDEEDD